MTEYRIKFSALRDIQAGEELFFNYGDYFLNLTKKLLEQDKDSRTSEAGISGHGGAITGGSPVKDRSGRGRKRKRKVDQGDDGSRGKKFRNKNTTPLIDRLDPL